MKPIHMQWLARHAAFGKKQFHSATAQSNGLSILLIPEQCLVCKSTVSEEGYRELAGAVCRGCHFIVGWTWSMFQAWISSLTPIITKPAALIRAAVFAYTDDKCKPPQTQAGNRALNLVMPLVTALGPAGWMGSCPS